MCRSALRFSVYARSLGPMYTNLFDAPQMTPYWAGEVNVPHHSPPRHHQSLYLFGGHAHMCSPRKLWELGIQTMTLAWWPGTRFN